MPKGIGYIAASKVSAFRRKKSEDEKHLKKFNPATEKVIRGLVETGLTREEAEKRVDKGARRRAGRGK